MTSLGRASIIIGSTAVAHRLAPLLASSQQHLPANPLVRVVGFINADSGAAKPSSGSEARELGGAEARARIAASGRTPVHPLSDLRRVVKALNVTTALITDADVADAHAHAKLAVDAGCTHIVNLTRHPLRGITPDAQVLLQEPLFPRRLSERVLPAALILSTGRFAREFRVVARIGRGGFGSVVSARNVLDGEEYAVKRVPFRLRSEGERALREARAMASLSRGCGHIVRYYASWVEALPADGSRSSSSGCSGSEDEEGSGEDEASASSGSGSGGSSQGGRFSEDEAEEADAEGRPGRAPRGALGQLFLQLELLRGPTLAQLNQALGQGGGSGLPGAAPPQPQARALAEPGAGDAPVLAPEWGAWQQAETVRQLATALAHAHGHGVVHRDVAPANVFVGTAEAEGGAAGQAGALPQLRVQLGDFGLCALQPGAEAGGAAAQAAGPLSAGSLAAVLAALHGGPGGGGAAPEAPPPAPAEPGRPGRSGRSARRASASGALGTFLYASPEQRAGGPASAASDVFSLGVVLAELLLAPLATAHERAVALTAFRERRCLPAFAPASASAGLRQLALEMAQPQPHLRPSAAAVAARAHALAQAARAEQQQQRQQRQRQRESEPQECCPLPSARAAPGSAADGAGGSPPAAAAALAAAAGPRPREHAAGQPGQPQPAGPRAELEPQPQPGPGLAGLRLRLRRAHGLVLELAEAVRALELQADEPGGRQPAAESLECRLSC